MNHGGVRPGAGRPKGAISKMSAASRQAAAATGELPHEFLLRVMRGEPIEDHTPTFEERLDAAKAAAPFYAPRLATQQVKLSGQTLREASDEELAAALVTNLRQLVDSPILSDAFAKAGWKLTRA